MATSGLEFKGSAVKNYFKNSFFVYNRINIFNNTLKNYFLYLKQKNVFTNFFDLIYKKNNSAALHFLRSEDNTL